MAVPAEYSVRVVAVAVAGRRLIPFSGSMTALFVALLAALRATIRSRLELAAEIPALGINSLCCNGARRNDRASVGSIGCSGCCSRAFGRTGGRRCRSPNDAREVVCHEETFPRSPAPGV